MGTLLTIVHVVVCLFLIGIVLLQHGKGADIGATFGGSSQSLFGSEGPLSLLNKITTGAAIIFMLTSVMLAYLASQTSTSSVMSNTVTKPVQQEATPLAQEEKMSPAQPVATETATEATQPAEQAAPATVESAVEKEAPAQTATGEAVKE